MIYVVKASFNPALADRLQKHVSGIEHTEEIRREIVGEEGEKFQFMCG